MNRTLPNLVIILLLFGLFTTCNTKENNLDVPDILPANTLDYSGYPQLPYDRSSLAFSDQGAWFAYGFSSLEKPLLGFTGPFLMTQGQGEWCSPMMSNLVLQNAQSEKNIEFKAESVSQNSYNSHLEQRMENSQINVHQFLYFTSPHSAITITRINNHSEKTLKINPKYHGNLFSTGLQLTTDDQEIVLNSNRSVASGKIQIHNNKLSEITAKDSGYTVVIEPLEIKPGETESLVLSHSFIFPEYDDEKEYSELNKITANPYALLQQRMDKKAKQLELLNAKLKPEWQDATYQNLLSKTVLTMQNNTRIPAGELKHAGLFPSYHYKWFLGFWAWDSWKHAAALAHYNPELAKDQVRAMYDFQLDNGFIVDCVYRDTTIEQHNYRNTKPPLSAWAVWSIYEQDKDIEFVKEMYPKIVQQHDWWYYYRDFDKDSICEYGSTDGTLVAAKWESGMDNAVRFDNSKMVKSKATVYSLNQESVDLNAYLYAEKTYLALMANELDLPNEASLFSNHAKSLKAIIQQQFFSEEHGWFFDTSMDGENFIEVMGCEGWIPLWANAASEKQAEAVKNHMMNPEHFYTKVPFQTLSASHPKFKPNRGYWRGPNWLDQAYFGVKGLQNYGYKEDAYKASKRLMHNAQGVLEKGPSIRENYQPITGEGLESENFSWSAAHYMLLLLGE